MACYINNEAIVHILLLRGADTSITCRRGGTPKQMAFLKMEIVKFIDDWPTLMVAIVLKKLIVYHEMEALTFIDINSYYKL